MFMGKAFNYRRSVEELEKLASNFWPEELSRQEAELSVIPKLLETQEDFISILRVPVSSLEGLFKTLEVSTLSGNLFLKHLVVLADVGAEMLEKWNAQFSSLFPDGNLVYLWNSGEEAEERRYSFESLPTGKITNKKLKIDGKNLLEELPLSPLQRDIVAILLLGSAAKDEYTAYVLAKCEISEYLGKPEKLSEFVRQRYIWVSKITAGSRANSLGQLVQKFVGDYLRENIGIPDIEIKPNGHIPGIRHTGDNDSRQTTFDLVVADSEHKNYLAIEVSFQETTNSVIERKSGQAQARYEQIKERGFNIAYVLDGAGNFRRKSALRTICNYSDCTVAFTQAELEVLCDFIRNHFMSGR